MRVYRLFILVCWVLSVKPSFADNIDCTELGRDNSDTEQGYYSTINGPVPCEVNHYCTGDGWAHCCPPDYPLSDGGINAKEMADCYKNVSCIHETMQEQITCKSYYDGITECEQGMTSNTDVAVHYENENEQEQCYTGHLNCDQFNVNGNNCSSSNSSPEITGTATYNGSTLKWNVSACQCQTDYPSDTCYAKSRYSMLVGDQNINTVATGITFSHNKGYSCIRCHTGYYVNHETDIDTENHTIQNCKADSVCQCTEIPKGKYLTEACTIEFTSPLNNTNQDICAPSNCPAGKTTETTGTIGEEQNVCSYDSNGTKFCDAKGCFTLNGINW